MWIHMAGFLSSGDSRLRQRLYVFSIFVSSRHANGWVLDLLFVVLGPV